MGRLGVAAALAAGLLVSPSRAIAATAIDLGVLPGGTTPFRYTMSSASWVNENGEVIGVSSMSGGEHPFFWTPSLGMLDILPPGYDQGAARGINGTGQVLGLAFAPGVSRSFVWTLADGAQLIDPLPGDEITDAYDINDAGEVVGWSRTIACCASPDHAFIWSPMIGTVDLGNLGGGYAVATRLNEAGQVTGTARKPSGEYTVFIWTEAGGMVDIGSLGGSDGNPAGISETGQIVGSSQTASGETHAFSWTASGGMVDLGTLGGTDSYASAVNDLGTVVGSSTTASGDTRAFVWTESGGMVDLGTLGGETFPQAINDGGQVVGSSRTGPNPNDPFHAFSWTQAGGMVDLGTLGGRTSAAYEVSDEGIAVGWADKSTTNYGHATLWDLGAPDDTSPPTITSASFSVDPVVQGNQTVLSVDVSDDVQVTDVEYHIPDLGWTLPAEPADPTFSTFSTFSAILIPDTTLALQPGTHAIEVRAVDAAGNWSPVTTVSLDVSPDDITAPTINSAWFHADPAYLDDGAYLYVDATDDVGVTEAEYFVDVDPGEGHAIPLYCCDLLHGQNVIVPVGTHTVGVRVRDQDGNWSATTTVALDVIDNDGPMVFGVDFSANPVLQGDVTVLSATADDDDAVAYAEYFIDTFTGHGSGIPMQVSGSSLTATLTANLTPGDHDVSVWARDPSGNWGENDRILWVVSNNGIPSGVEDSAPNGGDGNSDGIPDSEQGNVASLPANEPGAGSGEYVTLESPPGTSLESVIAEPTPPTAPPGTSFPLGILSFEVHGVAPGGTVDVTVMLPSGFAANTVGKVVGGTYYDLTGLPGTVVSGDSVTFTLQDGGPFDEDGDATNGVIQDPVLIGSDTTDPTVTCDAAVPQFTVGQSPARVYAIVADDGSGPADPHISAAVDTSVAGTASVLLTGYDNAGNSASADCSYEVLAPFRFEGFFAPVDNPPVVNKAKAGQTIPITWRLTDDAGVGVSDPASFVSLSSGSTSCSANDPTDTIETYAPGSSGLEYLGNGYWQFNWKTPKSYAGQCRIVRLNLSDGGTGRTASFHFKQ
jgi:probable HAF family extracellular repeat protein